MTERQRFNLHLPGLLKVLAEHLYSSKKVGVRELIQNSHDSCVRRRIEGAEEDYKPRIHLEIDGNKRMLRISDNGHGLTADEITNYLATIGRGYTRELRERLSLESAAEAGELIGQFGLGFLSAFLLASEVTLLTRSAQGGPCYRWQSAGDEYYEMVPGVREFGDLNVYIRKMFICERERDLLPPWARFVRGVIDSPLLQPTASRESIHQDENFELVRQSIEEQLGEGLRQLAEDDLGTWRRMVRGHADVIIGWAVSHNEFFERVED